MSCQTPRVSFIISHMDTTKGICYIIGAGEKCALTFVKTAADIVIAADGGLAYCREAGIEPDIIIGDFDSFGSVPDGKEVIRLNPIKDVTDTFAALEEGLKRHFSEFRLYCCTGGRLSHTVANIAALRYLVSKGARAKLISDGMTAEICKDRAEAEGCRYFSLFPCGESADVIIKNAAYPGEFTLDCRSSLGASNAPRGKAEITVVRGEVLVIIEF